MGTTCKVNPSLLALSSGGSNSYSVIVTTTANSMALKVGTSRLGGRGALVAGFLSLPLLGIVIGAAKRASSSDYGNHAPQLPWYGLSFVWQWRRRRWGRQLWDTTWHIQPDGYGTGRLCIAHDGCYVDCSIVVLVKVLRLQIRSPLSRANFKSSSWGNSCELSENLINLIPCLLTS